jgi:hypothetical protein
MDGHVLSIRVKGEFDAKLAQQIKLFAPASVAFQAIDSGAGLVDAFKSKVAEASPSEENLYSGGARCTLFLMSILVGKFASWSMRIASRRWARGATIW